jgi:hypothetical protein
MDLNSQGVRTFEYGQAIDKKYTKDSPDVHAYWPMVVAG